MQTHESHLTDEELIALVLVEGSSEREILLAERLGRALDALAEMEIELYHPGEGAPV